MKIVYCIISFIVAGSFGSANAAGYIEPFCMKNGGPKAYKAVVSGMVDAQICFQSTVTEMTSEYQKSGGKVDAAFAVYCGKVQDLKDCVTTFTDSVRSCLEPTQQEALDTFHNILSSLLQFACENSTLIGDAINSPNRECVTTKTQALKNCTKKLSNVRNQVHSDPGSDPLSFLPALEIKSNNQNCSNLQSFEECTVQVLKQCEDEIFSKILDSLYKYVNNDIPTCKNLPRSRRSDASPTRIVNVLLLLITITAISF